MFSSSPCITVCCFYQHVQPMAFVRAGLSPMATAVAARSGKPCWISTHMRWRSMSSFTR